MTDAQIQSILLKKVEQEGSIEAEELTKRTIELDSFEHFNEYDVEMFAEYLMFAYKLFVANSGPELFSVLLRSMYQLGYRSAFRTDDTTGN